MEEGRSGPGELPGAYLVFPYSIYHLPSTEYLRTSICATPALDLPFAAFPGEVSEWLKEHAWKVCIR